ncbi:HalOD1 output domain-containing protein [Halorussus aquaticus]|uniref:HalOD1 output domain-containing protein n=1 Tax=Halorussus aquaticus TaxID=2953748 RepID=A0ABD5Q3S2_9EURY|nr:HalOD1 output domain-containing protein [Halorussus aquaticus]
MSLPPDTRGCLELVDSMTAIEFDTNRGLFRAVYDRNRDSASLAVVALVATVLDEDPDRLAPLYSSIGGDAFERRFREITDTRRGKGHTSFSYEGFEVTVFGDGTIEADSLDTDVVGTAGE